MMVWKMIFLFQGLKISGSMLIFRGVYAETTEETTVSHSRSNLYIRVCPIGSIHQLHSDLGFTSRNLQVTPLEETGMYGISCYIYLYIYIWMFPKIVVPPQSSILKGFSIKKPSISGYPYFWKHPNNCIFIP